MIILYDYRLYLLFLLSQSDLYAVKMRLKPVDAAHPYLSTASSRF